MTEPYFGSEEVGQNLCGVEPVEQCPECGHEVHASFVDNGFGPFAVQGGPYRCFECGWIERGEMDGAAFRPTLPVSVEVTGE